MARLNIMETTRMKRREPFFLSRSISRAKTSDAVLRRFNAASRRVVMVITLALAGCAMEVETPREPPPTNYRQAVAEYIRKSFFDPYSIRDAGIAPPRPGWGFGGTSFGEYKTGWAVCVRANAKNRMGAYGGSKETIYIIQDGRVVASGQDLETSAARSGCEGAQYEPFPEIEEQARRR